MNSILQDTTELEVLLPYMAMTLDLSSPVWFGSYHGAKLGIFEAKSVKFLTEEAATMFDESVTYISVMTDIPEEEGGDGFVLYAHYHKSVSAEEISAHIISNTFIQYLKQKKMPPPDTGNAILVTHSNNTMH